MNCAPSPLPSPLMGERVAEGRVRGMRVGSCHRCAVIKPWKLPQKQSMATPGHWPRSLPQAAQAPSRTARSSEFYNGRD